MKTRSTIAVLFAASAAIMGAAGAAHAEIVPTKDSADFNLQINGETNPAVVYGSQIWETDGSGLLTFTPSGIAGSTPAADTGGAFGWTNQTSNAVGYTTEFRFRIDELPSADVDGSPFVLGLIASDGAASQYNVVGITADGVYRNTASFTAAGSNNTTAADLLVAKNFNDGAFHTIRVAEEANSNQTHLWVDDTLVTTEFAPFSFTLSRVWLGDLGNGVVDGQTSIDYFRLDNTGGFAPAVIPEPASVGLLAMGSLGLLARRRR